MSALAGAPRRLAIARPANVGAIREDGAPLVVDGLSIEHVRESWLVEDRWWAERPLRRRYWELVSKRGRNLLVFHDLTSGGWFRQR